MSQLGELMQMEEVLLKRDQWVHQLLNSPRQNVYVFNHETQRMVVGGAQHADLFGYETDEIKALPEGWRSIVHPDDRGAIRESTERMDAGEDGPTSLMCRIRRQGGGYETIALFRRVWQRSSKGKVLLELGQAVCLMPVLWTGDDLLSREKPFSIFKHNSLHGVLLLNEKGHIEEANDLAADLLARATTLESGSDFYQLFNRADGKALRALCTQPQEHPDPVRARTRNGARLVLIHARPLQEGRRLVQVQDLTNERELERAQLELFRLRSALLEGNTSGVAVLDEQLCIVFCNPALRRMLSVQTAEASGQPFRKAVASEDRLAFSAMIREAKKGHSTPIRRKLTLRRLDNTQLETRASFTPFFSGETGSFDGGLLALEDVSSTNAIHDQLSAELRLHSIFFKHTNILVALLSHEGIVVRINPAFEILLGFSSQELEGLPVWETPLFVRTEAERSRKRFESLINGKSQRQHALLHLRDRNAKTCVLELQSFPVHRDDGRIEMIVSAGIDITARVSQEAEVIRAAEAEQQRIGRELHDGVGQLLTGAISLTEALAFEVTGDAKKTSQRILEILRQATTDIRRLSHGLAPLVPEKMNLGDRLRMIAESVREDFGRDCQVEETSAGIDALNQESAIHLYRITQEAVCNAIRHGQASRIRIHLSREGPQTGCLEIEDNGKGMPTMDAPFSTGIGIQNMNYRATLVGGTFEVLGKRKCGVRVVCRFPIRRSKRSFSSNRS